MNAPRSSWWSRNWKWFVPCGCFGLIGFVLVGIGSIFMLVTTAMRSSDAYQDALATAQSNPEMIATLGEPIEAEWFISGNINVNDDSGDVDLKIPVHGPNGKATVRVTGIKVAGTWEYSVMQANIHGSGQVINLLDEAD
ncbi:MAG: cytochrome c oxidase assembly factor 1 family protein [Acidobacteria bacterium]|nr:cytochrome c oxidase assembly factor 1 family protein [Acidobacteriota bacterium]